MVEITKSEHDRNDRVINSGGEAVVDNIARSLSKKTKSEIVSINNSLNFTMPPSRNSPGNPNEIINIRRAAMLIEKTIATRLPPRLPHGSPPYDPESWDYVVLKEYINEHKKIATSVAGTGVYLAGSFWAYATEQERLHAIAAHAEAIELCTFGLVAANYATQGAAVGPSRNSRLDIYFDITRMWFGGAADTAKIVKDNLKLTLSGLKSNYIGLSYAGPSIKPGSKLKEKGFSGGSASQVTAMGGFAHVFPVANQNKITLDKEFFNPNETEPALEEQIVGIHENLMQVSRGGAVLHEATHLYAGTRDIVLNNAVYTKLGLTPPTDSTKREKGYGSLNCFAIVKEDPGSARENADSYRIFCEAAKYHRQHA